MNTDIRIDCNFRTNPKTKKLKRRGGLEMVDCLIALWIWAAMNRPSGDLSGLDEEDIELAADWIGEPGLFFSSIKDGWLDKTENGYAIHDWSEHQPWVSQAEERGNKARLSRLARKCPDKYKELSELGVTGVTKEEYHRYTTVQRPYNEPPTNRTAPAPAPAPTPVVNKKQKNLHFDQIAFRPDYIPEKLWLSFLENRKFKKVQNSELALTTVCNQFVKAIGNGHSIEDCISEFVEGKWTKFKAAWMDNAKKDQTPRSKRDEANATRSQWARELLDAENSNPGHEGMVHKIQGPTA